MKRILIRVPATQAVKKHVASVDVVTMAVAALSVDPTTRLKAGMVQAEDIQGWIDEKMCTLVDIASIDAAMNEIMHKPGARA